MKVVIAAAGTGGHINPGIAIANKIVEKEKDSEILFIGTPRGLENNLVPKAGYELKTVDSYGIPRKISFESFRRIIKTYKSINEAKQILQEFNPDIVIGTGGYICISVCKAAKKLNIPYVIHESNALPGVAVKMVSKHAKKVMISFQEAKKRLGNYNTVVTGTPTKVNKLDYSDEEIENKKEKLTLKRDVPLVLVFGGSQGAKSINESIIKLVNRKLYEHHDEENKNQEQDLNTIHRMDENKVLKETTFIEEDKENKIDYQILMATGNKNFDEIKNEISSDAEDGIVIKPYIYEMEEALNISDLIVARSGAMTVTEIEKVGKPSILIPYPYAAENHQEFNARALEDAGCAKVILDNDLNEYILDRNIREIIKDKNKQKEMGKIASSLITDDVEEKIYNIIREVVDQEEAKKSES